MSQDHPKSARTFQKNSRRQWISTSALASVGLLNWPGAAIAQGKEATAPKALPDYAAWKNPGSLIVHTPNTIETQRSAFGTSIITPAEQLYIRNNLAPPPASILNDRWGWEVAIEGVKNPRTFTIAQLKTMGLETLAMVLQCSGNGRGFFTSKPSGTPWGVGAAGCVIWSGVPVRTIVRALGGVVPGLGYMTGTGGETLPEGVDPKLALVERSLPLAAMGDALLAWEMNGSPVSLAHGGPLRLIVPGYQGVNHVKYIKRLAFTERESDAKIMAHGYRMTPPGMKADATQASVLEMNVKSWINGPHPDHGTISPGAVLIHGVAFSGLSGVKHVDVSTDGGSTWQRAMFVGPDLGKFAWRQFALQTSLPRGTHLLMSRATDQAGNVQPQVRLENVSGYNNNSWLDHGLSMLVA
jgi:sulfite oxidase